MRPISTRDMADFRYLSGLTMSSDESFAAAVCWRSDLQDGKWYGDMQIVSLKSGQTRRLSAGEHVTLSSPRFHADGCLYFLSNVSGENQLVRVQADRIMEIQPTELAALPPLTHLPHGITRFDVAGDTVLIETPLWPEEIEQDRWSREMTEDERREFQWMQEYGPREITEIDYKRDECFGVRDGSVPTLCVLSLTNQSIRRIPCAFPLTFPRLSPDARRAACHGQGDKGPFFSSEDLYAVDLQTDTVVRLTEDRMLAGEELLFTKDGESIVYPAWFLSGDCMICELRKIPFAGGESLPLFDFDQDEASGTRIPGFDGMPLCRTQYGPQVNLLHLSENGSDILFLCAMDGTENLYRCSLDGKQVPATVLQGDDSIHEFLCKRDGGLVTILGSDHEMPDIFEIPDPSKPVLHRLTDVNPQLREMTQGTVFRQWVPTRDGTAKVHSMVIRPAVWEEGKRYPAVLYLHGGPTVCYTNDFWHEIQILAGAGFAVICCDPRGSTGYGLRHCNEEQSWGQEAIDDMMDCIDAACTLGFIDPERVGITGGSYGGYMTCKLIMNTDRFRAAVGQRVFVNKATSYGTGDMGFYSARKPWNEVVIKDCLMERSRTSIIRNLDNIRCPLLLLHGYADYRCSFEQAEQMFIGLHERKPDLPVKLVMFPGANHNVSRTGLLPHRMRHVQEMVDWFCRYLTDSGEVKEA